MKRSTKLVIAGGSLLVIVGGCSAAISAASGGNSTSSPPAATSATQPASSPSSSSAPAQSQGDKVTFIVTGSTADVTYGPSGSSFSGSVPMHKTMKIPDNPPSYYALTIQLQGGGNVSCKVLVNGKTVSTARASGGYNIANCEIVQDPLTGKWESA